MEVRSKSRQPVCRRASGAGGSRLGSGAGLPVCGGFPVSLPGVPQTLVCVVLIGKLCNRQRGAPPPTKHA
eukprot:4082691-Lingulodinium_polyedra.AAC.1